MYVKLENPHYILASAPGLLDLVNPEFCAGRPLLAPETRTKTPGYPRKIIVTR